MASEPGHLARDPTRSYGAWQPAHDGFVQRVRESFARQGLMGHLGARLVHVGVGHVEVEATLRPQLTQQHGYMHAGVSAALADTAGGYAALSLFPADASVLSSEFKVHLLRPACGPVVRAVAHVVRPGSTLTVCDLEAYDVALDGTRGQLVLKGSQTLVRLDGVSDSPPDAA